MSILRWLTGPPKPNSPTPRSEPGTVPSSRSDQKSGLAAYSAADDPALFERIHALQSTNAFAAAYALLGQALAQRPNDPTLLLEKGSLLLSWGRLLEASV